MSAEFSLKKNHQTRFYKKKIRNIFSGKFLLKFYWSIELQKNSIFGLPDSLNFEKNLIVSLLTC